MQEDFHSTPFADQPASQGHRNFVRESSPSQSSRSMAGKPDRLGIYSVGGPVSSPILTYSEPAINAPGMEHLDVQGTVMVTAIIGVDGVPSAADVVIPFLRPLDRAAVKATNQLRFEPGKLNGHPVPVRIFVEFTFPRGEGVAVPSIVQRPHPLEPPEALNSVWVAYPKRARRRRLNGTVVISFVVTKKGEPAQIQLVRSVARDLDESALRAVQRLRFKPASVDSKPVPSYVTMDVKFVLYY